MAAADVQRYSIDIRRASADVRRFSVDRRRSIECRMAAMARLPPRLREWVVDLRHVEYLTGPTGEPLEIGAGARWAARAGLRPRGSGRRSRGRTAGRGAESLAGPPGRRTRAGASLASAATAAAHLAGFWNGLGARLAPARAPLPALALPR